MDQRLAARVEHITNEWLDTSVWDNFQFQPGDHFVVTYPRSGTTWVQQIANSLIRETDDVPDLWRISPWVEVPMPLEEKLAWLADCPRPRLLKSHSPFALIKYSSRYKYICVFRDIRDIILSHYDLFYSYASTVTLAGLRPKTLDEYFNDWLDHDFGALPLLPHIKSWMAQRGHQNILFLHYHDLSASPLESIIKISQFLNIEVNSDRLNKIVLNSTFSTMKNNSATLLAWQERRIRGSSSKVINRGTDGRWRSELSPKLAEAVQLRVEHELGQQDAEWILRS